MRIAAILMAAGFSRRMESLGDKLLLPYNGRPLLAHAVELLAGLPFSRRIVVSTPERFAAAPLPGGMTAVVNPAPEAGQSGSLRLGVEAAGDADAYMFFTADQPLLDRATVEWLLAHADAEHIVYPVVEGRPASPSVFPARFRAELLAQRGDAGGRAVRAAHPEACRPLEAQSPLPFWDIDTREDYETLQEYRNSLRCGKDTGEITN